MASLVLLAFTGLLIAVLYYTASRFTSREPVLGFDRERWLQNVNDRWKMAPDLIKRQLLTGKDSSDVKALLGEPTGRIDSVGRWVYYMGEGVWGFGAHFDHLNVVFKEGTVAEVIHLKARD